MNDALWGVAAQQQDAAVDFARRLVQTPSPSGQEGAVAALVQAEMQALGYDQVWTDAAGSVIGVLRGQAPGRRVLFNCHLDHVDPGDLAAWPQPPYAGQIREGALWGRGASDTKGALAAQVYAAAGLKRAGVRFRGEIVVAAVVMEEVGGLGTLHLLEHLRPDVAVLGEATSNQIARGHRGRVELEVTVTGRSAHASAPGRGVNPHYVLARFIEGLASLPMEVDPELGPASQAPTLYHCDQVSPNVIPGQCRLTVDWRNVPAEAPEDIAARVRPLLEAGLLPGSQGTVTVARHRLRAYTGLERELPAVFPSYLLPPDHALVAGAQGILAQALGRPVEVGCWGFATDGGHLMAAGVPTIGFSPCEEALAHTASDRVALDKMLEATVGYMALGMGLG